MGLTAEDRSTAKWLLGVALLVAVVFGGTFAALRWNALRRDRGAHGKLRQARLVRLVDGRAAFLAFEEVLHPGGEDGPDEWTGRLDLIDGATGGRLARAIRVEARDCRPASPGRVWCYERSTEPPRDQTLVLRDLATLAVVVSEEQLATHAPAIAKGIATSRGGPYVDPDGGAALATVNDGTTWRIDPAGCPAACRASVHDDAGTIPSHWAFGNASRSTAPSVQLSGSDFRFSGDGGGALVRRAITSFGAHEERLGTTRFLEGAFFSDASSPTPRPLVLAGDRLLVVHADTLDAAKAKKLLSAVDLSGNVSWRVELGQGDVGSGFRVVERGVDVLVIPVQAERGWLIAIDPRDGSERWRTST